MLPMTEGVTAERVNGRTGGKEIGQPLNLSDRMEPGALYFFRSFGHDQRSGIHRQYLVLFIGKPEIKIVELSSIFPNI